ncbi:terminase small subunit [Eikenella halliae]
MTPKQERFVGLYVETGNASEAYRQAYNAGKQNWNRHGIPHRRAAALPPW